MLPFCSSHQDILAAWFQSLIPVIPSIKYITKNIYMCFLLFLRFCCRGFIFFQFASSYATMTFIKTPRYEIPKATYTLHDAVESLSCVRLCNPMDCSTPGFPVLHYVLEFAQTHVLWVNDVTQPSHPLLLPFPPALSRSQYQGSFQLVGSEHQVAEVLQL